MTATTPGAAGGRRPGALQVAVVVALVALALVVGQVARVHDGDWTGPFLVGERLAQQPGWPIAVRVGGGPTGYDGQFFLVLALDPLLRTPLRHGIDDLSYRARRITWSLGAWLLGAGDPERRLLALVLLLVGAVSGTGALVARWAEANGASPWWGVAGALGLGTIVCLLRMLGDAVMVFLLVQVVVLCENRWRPAGAWAAIVLALAVLQKETAALALPILAGALVRGRGTRGLGFLALPCALVGAWWWFVRSRVEGPTPFELAITFAPPGVGPVEVVEDLLESGVGLLRIAKSLFLLGLHVLAVGLGLVVGWSAAIGWRRTGRGDPLAISIGLFALLGTVLSARIWVEPWSYARVLLPLVTLELLHSLRASVSAPGGRTALWCRGLAVASAVAGWAFVLRSWIGRVA